MKRAAMSPVISVLLPYRDVGSMIEAALAGILAERVPLEVIAVDDGSRDDGPRLVARMAAEDPRVVPIATGGVGIPAALARALAVARGRFIARMDGDDLSLPGRLERSLELLMRDDRLAAVGTQVEAFPDHAVGEGMQRYVAWLNSLITPEDHERDLFVESPLCHPSVTMRREALERVGGYRELPWPEDYDLWLRFSGAGYRLAKVPEMLFRWRHREERATVRDPRYSLAMFDAAKAHYLAARLIARGRPPAVWGAGKTGRRIARVLAQNGARSELFVDIDPKKIGRTAQGAPIVAPEGLPRGKHTVVVAVGARGARQLVRAWLDAAGFVEGDDYLCAS